MVFATTTCLGYTRCFERPEMRDHMASLLADDCRHYGAVLHAFCIMEHHVHAVIRGPVDHEVNWLMQRIKSNSAKTLLPLLTSLERSALETKQTSSRSFWQSSYRGIIINSEERRWRCIKYIHLNPVRAGYCETLDAYRWSSAWMYEQGLATEDEGVTLAACEAFPRTIEFGWR